MNKIILSILAVSALMVSGAMAAGPTFLAGRDSSYIVTQSSISISSMAVGQTGALYQGARQSAVSGYRNIKIQLLPTRFQDGVTVFYTLNGSTANIYDIGFVVRVSTLVMGVSPAPALGVTLGGQVVGNEIEIESNSQLNFMTAPGVAPIAGRKLEIKLPN